MEFTAVYEPQADGTVVGYVAEVPGASVVGRTIDEARTRLAQKLRQAIDSERDAALARLGPGARVESIQLAAAARRETQVESRSDHDTRMDAPELDLLGLLRTQGRIADLPNELDDDFEPIPAEGKPISQEIIEGRR
jgi:predicted RNase H-like HicB family nuclease